MPYISIKCYPKDAETKQQVVDDINKVFLAKWGCPPEAISISLEEVAPENWHNVEESEVTPKADKMYVLHGEKKY